MFITGNVRITELPDTPISPEQVAIADRGYRCLYTGVDLSGWHVSGEWKAEDWTLCHTGREAGRLTAAAEFKSGGFLLDFLLENNATQAAVVLAGTQLALGAGTDFGDAIESGKWNRIEGELRDGKLTLQINGQQVAAPRPASAGGPLAIEASGPVKFAGIYVRD